MAAIRSYKNGAGGSTGADLAVLKPTLASGNYWYVGNTVVGASDSNAGTERGKPLLTTTQANTNAAAGDTIVFLSGHNEVLSTAVTFSHSGLSLVGEGTGASVPRFTNSVAATMWNVSGTGITLDNLYFPAGNTAQVRIAASGAFSHFKGLQFDCGSSDTATASMLLSAPFTGRLQGCRFTSVGATPTPGLAVAAAFAATDITMDSVTFDGGSFGWATYAFLVGAGATVARLRMTRISQFLGAHFLIPTGTAGTINITAATSDSRCDWSP